MAIYESYFELDELQHKAKVGFYKNDKTNGGWRPIMLGMCGTKADPRYMATFVNQPGDWYIVSSEDLAPVDPTYNPSIIAAAGAPNNAKSTTVYEKVKSQVIYADTFGGLYAAVNGIRSFVPTSVAIFGAGNWQRIVAVVRQPAANYRWSYTLHAGTNGPASLDEVKDYVRAMGVGRVRPILIAPFRAQSSLLDDPGPTPARADNLLAGASFVPGFVNYLVVWEDSVLGSANQTELVLEDIGPTPFAVHPVLSTGADPNSKSAFAKTEVIAAGCMGGEPEAPVGRGLSESLGAGGRGEILFGSAGGTGPTSTYYVGILALTHSRRPKAPTVVGSSADPAFGVLDAIVANTLNNGARHAALAVVKNGKLYYAKGFTQAEDTYEAVTPSSNFRLASCSKSITAIAIMKLIENGSLQLTDLLPDAIGPLFAPIPGFEIHPDWYGVTVDHLLQMRSGIPKSSVLNTTDTDAVLQYYKDNGAPEPTVPVLRKHHLQFLAGRLPKNGNATPVPNLGKDKYVNVNFVLLAEILANKTGKVYEKVIRELILDPLKIPDSMSGGIGPTRNTGDPVQQAVGEAFYNDQVPQVGTSANHPDRRRMIKTYTQNAEMDLGTSYWSMSILDVARILAGLYPSGLILGSSTRASMWQQSPANPQRARGWDVAYASGASGGLVSASKGGSDPGTGTKMWYWADDVAAVLLTTGKANIVPVTGAFLKGALDAIPAAAWSGPGIWSSFGYPAL